jgi:hypothetical protein
MTHPRFFAPLYVDEVVHESELVVRQADVREQLAEVVMTIRFSEPRSRED